MSKARLVITAVTVEKRSVSEVARSYGVARSWIYAPLARYRAEGEAAFEPRSRRPKTSPSAIPDSTADLIILLHKELAGQGLDAGPHTIAWHLQHHHQVGVSAATISRYLSRAGLVTPEPRKRPRSSYIRFEAELPNECWQADFTHYPLAGGAGIEILTWLDDHSRLVLHLTEAPARDRPDRACRVPRRHRRARHPGLDADRYSRWVLAECRRGRQGPVENPVTGFASEYNQRRPHKSLPHQATPSTAYQTRPKASPGDRAGDTHDRVRTDRVHAAGTVTLRTGGRLHHIGVGRTYAGTSVLLIIQDLDIRIINAATGELLRALTLDPSRDYQPTGRPPGPQRKTP